LVCAGKLGVVTISFLIRIRESRGYLAGKQKVTGVGDGPHTLEILSQLLGRMIQVGLVAQGLWMGIAVF
jgi:hypothetical protein